MSSDSTPSDEDQNNPPTAASQDAPASGKSSSGKSSSEESSSGESSEEQTPHLTVVPLEPLDDTKIRCVVEAALLAADEALTLDRLYKLFVPGELAEEGGRGQVRDAVNTLIEACEGRGFELRKVASGYRMQVRQDFSPWVSRLWEEKPPRYTRALLETMALIAYKQPATRGDIEEVRGVTVSSNIMRTLLERGWIRELGHRDVPGRPTMYGTTKEFLDYFNLSSLDQLPSLPEIRELVEPAAQPEEEPQLEKDENTQALLDRGAEPPPEVDPETEIDTNTEADAESETEADAESEAEAETDPTAETDGIADAQARDEPAGDELTVVTDSKSDGGNTAAAPVFDDNEVLVVDETASVQVRQSDDLDDQTGDAAGDHMGDQILPQADAQD